MLTESEREWLNNRDNYVEHFCRWCNEWENCLGDLVAIACPSWPKKVQLREAAEFSERVAATLAADENSGIDEDCPPNMPYGWGRLKAARLKVEEEMDAD